MIDSKRRGNKKEEISRGKGTFKPLDDIQCVRTRRMKERRKRKKRNFWFFLSPSSCLTEKKSHGRPLNPHKRKRGDFFSPLSILSLSLLKLFSFLASSSFSFPALQIFPLVFLSFFFLGKLPSVGTSAAAGGTATTVCVLA